MNQYQSFDQAYVRRRVDQFRDQVARRLSGALSEEEFRPLRLMNGVYLQLHAYMLRVAIPYGTLNGRQLAQLAKIADTWDRGYGHFTTRQNIQFNWPTLESIPDMLEALAEVDMHAIQTSGNCIRNVTTDHFAGAAMDEIEDPRPIAELIRQWSTDHPEFLYMPRKFKIAVNGATQDRAVVRAHDIGLQAVQQEGEVGYSVYVGGGLGRKPMTGQLINSFVKKADLLPYLESIVHVWNRHGRRDNKYKARIKILLQELGLERLTEEVNHVFPSIRATYDGSDQAELKRIAEYFKSPSFRSASLEDFNQTYHANLAFRQFVDSNTQAHQNSDHTIVTVSTKPIGGIPGDLTSSQMRALAQLAKDYGYDECRVSHEQNLVLPHVHKADLPALYEGLKKVNLATANVGQISDIIACPGLDYCSLATARSIPIAQQISAYFDARAEEIGELKIKISGCINACGHHHVGHIGLLGLNRGGEEYYQLTLGGDGSEQFRLGERTGPGLSAEQLIPAIERMIDTYLLMRQSSKERFVDCLVRLGSAPFIEALYNEHNQGVERHVA